MSEFTNFVNKNMDLYEVIEPAVTRPRTESSFTIEEGVNCINAFIEKFWDGVSDRMKFFDLDGVLSWPEAPAKSMFSIWQHVVDHRFQLTNSHTEALVRLTLSGPKPGTKAACEFMEESSKSWPSSQGLKFTTNDWQKGSVSKLVASALNCSDDM